MRTETGSELWQVLAELEMCSHVNAVNLAPSGRDAGEDIGGKRPPGGVDYAEDRHRTPLEERDDARVLRSAHHYRRQLARGRSSEAVLREARLSLEAFRHQPTPDVPLFGDPLWKRWVADSTLPSNVVAEMFGCKTRYINKIRAAYRVIA